jgi:hypothetical protein
MQGDGEDSISAPLLVGRLTRVEHLTISLLGWFFGICNFLLKGIDRVKLAYAKSKAFGEKLCLHFLAALHGSRCNRVHRLLALVTDKH